MSYELRLPNITASTSEAQLQQLQSYVYQLVQQLNWALNNIEQAESGGSDSSVVLQQTGNTAISEAEAQETFAAIKSLIIKSADIVNAYGDVIETTLRSKYEALSDFGTYQKDVERLKTETAGLTTDSFKIREDLDELTSTVIDTNGYIRTGIIDEIGDTQVIGIEVGQTQAVNGEKTFSRFARFTDNGVYFYSQGRTDPVAYMSNQKLYITDAVITRSIRLGGYELDLTNGIAFKWVGRD